MRQNTYNYIDFIPVITTASLSKQLTDRLRNPLPFPPLPTSVHTTPNARPLSWLSFVILRTVNCTALQSIDFIPAVSVVTV